MSTWHEPAKEDMSLSDDKKELHVDFDADYNGRIYFSLKIEDILEVIGKKQ